MPVTPSDTPKRPRTRRSAATPAAPARKSTRSSAAPGKKAVKQIVDGKVSKPGRPARAPRKSAAEFADAPARKRAPRALASAPAQKSASGRVRKPVVAGAPDGLPKRRQARTVDAAEALRKVVLHALEEMKARDLVALDVRQKTSVTDWFIIVSGTSSRHVKSLAEEVIKAAKAIKMPPMGVEGEREGEWVVVDLGDIVVHVMQPRAREFYALEKLWGVGEAALPQVAV